MKITLIFEEKISTLDVDPSLNIGALKTLAQGDLGVASSAMSILLGGRTLNDSQSISASGIKEGDLLQVTRRSSSSSASSSSSSNPLASIPRAVLNDPAQFYQYIKNTPALMQYLLHNDPQLAEASLAETPELFIEILNARVSHGRQMEVEEERRMRQLEADPFNPEAQARIAEEIRRKNIEENMAMAIEHNPEAFARVVMLYIPIKVNGIPLTAFVDSGAQSTIMSLATAERCNIHHLIDRRFSGVAKGVGTGTIVGRVHNCKVEVGGIFIMSSFTILERSDIDLLFGLDQLRKHQAAIDLKENCLRLYDKNIPFLQEKDLPTHIKREDHGDSGSSSSSSSSSSSLASTSSRNTPVNAPLSGNRGAIPGSSTLLRPNASPHPSSPSPSSSTTHSPARGPSPAIAQPPAAAISGTVNPAAAAAAIAAALGVRPQSTASSSIPSTAPASSRAGAGGLPAGVTEEKIRKLVELGFSREESIQALVRAGGNEDVAASFLF